MYHCDTYKFYPSKHEVLTQCWADVGPSSTTLAQHEPNIGPTPRVYCPDVFVVVMIWGTEQFKSYNLRLLNHQTDKNLNAICFLFLYKTLAILCTGLVRKKWNVKSLWITYSAVMAYKHNTFTQYWHNVGPAAQTLSKHWVNISCLLGCMLSGFALRYCN